MTARRGTRIPYPTSLDELCDLDVQITALLRRGLGYTEIGRRVGIHDRTISSRAEALYWLHQQHGITLPIPMQGGRIAIARTLDDLGPKDQQLIALFHQGIEYAEIGRLLDMPRQTVATRIARLRHNLGEHFMPRRHNPPAGEHRNTTKQSGPNDRAGRVRCLGGCDKHFDSPDRCRIRICSKCKEKHRESGEPHTEYRLFTA